MANVIQTYRAYREHNAAEFKAILKKVANAVLATTEKIPKDLVLRKYIRYRDWILGGDDSFVVDDGYLHIVCNDGAEEIGDYPYDDTAVKELNEFLEKQFHCIVCCDAFYDLDVYNGTLGLYFDYEPDIGYDDFDGRDLKPDRREKDKTWAIELFNDYVKAALGMELKYDDWEINKLERYSDGTVIQTSNVITNGSVRIVIPIY